MRINNDVEFKQALDGLDVHQQRRVGATFVESVLSLSNDVRVSSAVGLVKHSDVSDIELDTACQAVNSARVESFTQCGKETDWLAQAGHFVAKAALCCVRPPEPDVNLAWEAAMAARMARTCESVAEGKGTENHEIENQYRILYELLNR
jgi:hypothetical protein